MVNARHKDEFVGKERAMAEKHDQQQHQSRKDAIDEKHVPATDHESTAVAEPSSQTSPRWHEPDGIQQGIADADKRARTGSTEETVRNTPPAGAWNETSAD
jgi:hypothetical protein